LQEKLVNDAIQRMIVREVLNHTIWQFLFQKEKEKKKKRKVHHYL